VRYRSERQFEVALSAEGVRVRESIFSGAMSGATVELLS